MRYVARRDSLLKSFILSENGLVSRNGHIQPLHHMMITPTIFSTLLLDRVCQTLVPVITALKSVPQGDGTRDTLLPYLGLGTGHRRSIVVNGKHFYMTTVLRITTARDVAVMDLTYVRPPATVPVNLVKMISVPLGGERESLATYCVIFTSSTIANGNLTFGLVGIAFVCPEIYGSTSYHMNVNTFNHIFGYGVRWHCQR